MPENREIVVQGATNVFTTVHSLDMKIIEADDKWVLGNGMLFFWLFLPFTWVEKKSQKWNFKNAKQSFYDFLIDVRISLAVF